MVKVSKQGIVLSKTELGFENEGVLNPAVIKVGECIHLYYRAVSKGNYSSIGYCTLDDTFNVSERFDTPALFPQFEYETHGVEDPRIVKIDDLYYLTYTGYDGVNALGVLSTSKDLITWERQGIIVPQIIYKEFNRFAGSKNPLNEKYKRFNDNGDVAERKGKKVLLWDKNVMFFPRRIDGKLHFLHRIKPDIQIVCINELSELTPEFWQNYFYHFENNIVLSPKHDFEINYIGGGCPPIETPHGWLLIYHAVHDSIEGYVYSACAALLDLNNPQKELARLPYPLFFPEERWELKGEVNNVCFPTGAVLIEDTLNIYYGAADERIALACVSMSELIQELLNNLKSPENEK
jgi:beta-1,2-mannobiose phosphorylase / 1,2-beta-oligomannan phosphorylase